MARKRLGKVPKGKPKKLGPVSEGEMKEFRRIWDEPEPIPETPEEAESVAQLFKDSEVVDVPPEKPSYDPRQMELDIPREPEDAPTYYSKLREVIESNPQEKYNADQLGGYLQKQGVKPDEVKWTGLDDYLKEKKTVTKKEIRDFLDANEIKIEDRVRGGQGGAEDELSALEESGELFDQWREYHDNDYYASEIQRATFEEAMDDYMGSGAEERFKERYAADSFELVERNDGTYIVKDRRPETKGDVIPDDDGNFKIFDDDIDAQAHIDEIIDEVRQDLAPDEIADYLGEEFPEWSDEPKYEVTDSSGQEVGAGEFDDQDSAWEWIGERQNEDFNELTRQQVAEELGLEFEPRNPALEEAEQAMAISERKYTKSRVDSLAILEKGGVSQTDAINMMDRMTIRDPSAQPQFIQDFKTAKEIDPLFDWESMFDHRLEYKRAQDVARRETMRASTEATEHGSYVLPGGKNYREITLKMKPKKATFEHFRKDEGGSNLLTNRDIEIRRSGNLLESYDKNTGTRLYTHGHDLTDHEATNMALDLANRSRGAAERPWKVREVGQGGWMTSFKTEEEAINHIAAMNKTWHTTSYGQPEYKGGHFEDDVLAHARFNERFNERGQKVLFVEEIQSDWASAGRKEGFRRALTSEEKARQVELTMKNKELVAARDDIRNTMDNMKHGSPEMIEAKNARSKFEKRMEDEYGTFDVSRFTVNERAESQRTMSAMHKASEEIPLAKKKLRENLVERHSELNREIEGVEREFSKLTRQPTSGVSPAPFVTSNNWIDLMMKRLVRWAAETGFDEISWTTGKQQVERWQSGLRRAVDSVEWGPGTPVESQTERLMAESGELGKIVKSFGDDPGDIRIIGKKNNGNVFDEAFDAQGMSIKELQGQKRSIAEVFGESVAKQIKAEKTGKIDSENLTIGGEGFKSVYDRMMPQAMKRLGKKFKTKPKEGRISTSEGGYEDAVLGRWDTKLEAENYAIKWRQDRPNAPMPEIHYNPLQKTYDVLASPQTKVHSMEITPEMKRSVMKKGQPLFAVPIAAGAAKALEE